MKPSAPKKPTRKDEELFKRLIEAYLSKRLIIGVRANRLNKPGSPVWSRAESIAPLLALIFISAMFAYIFTPIIGVAMLVVSVIIYLFAIRPFVVKSLFRRTLASATQNLHNWDLLWKKGGLFMVLNFRGEAPCSSPDDDWRTFVARHFRPEPSPGSEMHDDLRGVDASNPELEKLGAIIF